MDLLERQGDVVTMLLFAEYRVSSTPNSASGVSPGRRGRIRSARSNSRGARGPEWAVVGAGVQFTVKAQTYLNGTAMCAESAPGTTRISSAEIHALPTRSANGGPVTLGMQSKTANHAYRNLKGCLGEVIIWNRWLTPGQRKDRECYLAQRFGIALSHPCSP